MNIYKSRTYRTPQGVLYPYELKELPFEPKRIFWIRDVPQHETRADHAHKQCEQFLIPMRGSFQLYARNSLGEVSLTVHAEAPDHYCYHIPTLNWLRLTNFSWDAVLCVLASRPYEVDDYVNVYEDFKKMAGIV